MLNVENFCAFSRVFGNSFHKILRGMPALRFIYLDIFMHWYEKNSNGLCQVRYLLRKLYSSKYIIFEAKITSLDCFNALNQQLLNMLRVIVGFRY